MRHLDPDDLPDRDPTAPLEEPPEAYCAACRLHSDDCECGGYECPRCGQPAVHEGDLCTRCDHARMDEREHEEPRET